MGDVMGDVMGVAGSSHRFLTNGSARYFYDIVYRLPPVSSGVAGS